MKKVEMQGDFRDVFGSYPAGVFQLVQETTERYCRRPKNKKRYEDFLMSQGFGMREEYFRNPERDKFYFMFEVVAYEFFADEFIPKSVMVISLEEGDKKVRMGLSSRVTD